MAWFNRSNKHEKPDSALPMFTVEQAARFVAAARRAFAEAGIETLPVDGRTLIAGGTSVYLDTIASHAAQIPERKWPQLLARHARAIAPALDGTGEAAPVHDDQIHLRILDRRTAPTEIEVWEDVVGDLVAVLGIDYPDRVETAMSAQAVDDLGGWASVREKGLRNLRALAAEDTWVHPVASGGTIHVSSGGYFHASRLLVLANVLAADFKLELPTHGVLVAVPNRSVIAVLPVVAGEVVGALNALLELVADHAREPGGLSDDVFFWRDGIFEQVTRRPEGGGNTVSIMATGMFGQTLTELGMMGGS